MPWMPNEAGDKMWFPYTTFAFLVGASTSMLCGFIGMKVATHANVRTTSECCKEGDAGKMLGFDVAFKGG